MRILHVVVVLLAAFISIIDGYCDSLSGDATWEDLIYKLDEANNFGGLVLFCPFEISGSRCPSENVTYTVETYLELVCLPQLGLTGDRCMIDCPTTQFVVQGELHIESMTFSSAERSVINVEPFGFLKAMGSIFENNRSFMGGGAIKGGVDSEILIQTSTFRNNHASIGGAIYSEGELIIDGSTFWNNSADRVGGAIYTGSGTLSFAWNTLGHNSAGVDGPAIYSDAENPSEQLSFSDNSGCENSIGTSLDAVCDGVVWKGTQCAAFSSTTCNVLPTPSPSSYLPDQPTSPTRETNPPSGPSKSSGLHSSIGPNFVSSLQPTASPVKVPALSIPGKTASPHVSTKAPGAANILTPSTYPSPTKESGATFQPSLTTKSPMLNSALQPNPAGEFSTEPSIVLKKEQNVSSAPQSQKLYAPNPNPIEAPSVWQNPVVTGSVRPSMMVTTASKTPFSESTRKPIDSVPTTTPEAEPRIIVMPNDIGSPTSTPQPTDESSSKPSIPSTLNPNSMITLSGKPSIRISSPGRTQTSKPKYTEKPSSHPTKAPVLDDILHPIFTRTPSKRPGLRTDTPSKPPLSTLSPTQEPTDATLRFTQTPTSATNSRSQMTLKPAPEPTTNPAIRETTTLPSRSPLSTVAFDVPSTRPITTEPTTRPSRSPASLAPASAPSTRPVTTGPTGPTRPTALPTRSPVTLKPASSPATRPITTQPTTIPSRRPLSVVPASAPSTRPITTEPTTLPSRSPVTLKPASAPSTRPITTEPTTLPSRSPVTLKPASTSSTRPITAEPTTLLSRSPVTLKPASAPSTRPITTEPTTLLSRSPVTLKPASAPSTRPVTTGPTAIPSRSPLSVVPASAPSTRPITEEPTTLLSRSPVTLKPASAPSTRPITTEPTALASRSPVTLKPASAPSMRPVTTEPTTLPSRSQLTFEPTSTPSKRPFTEKTFLPTQKHIYTSSNSPTTVVSITLEPISTTPSMSSRAMEPTPVPSETPLTKDATTRPSYVPVYWVTSSPRTEIPFTRNPSPVPSKRSATLRPSLNPPIIPVSNSTEKPLTEYPTAPPPTTSSVPITLKPTNLKNYTELTPMPSLFQPGRNWTQAPSGTPMQTSSEKPSTSQIPMTKQPSPHSHHTSNNITSIQPSLLPTKGTPPSVAPFESLSLMPSIKQMPSYTPSRAQLPSGIPVSKEPSTVPAKITSTEKPSIYAKKSQTIAMPTQMPSSSTEKPSQLPAKSADIPTSLPSKSPITKEPTKHPTKRAVTETPTSFPSKSPITEEPTYHLIKRPVTATPTSFPSESPITEEPTYHPTRRPVNEIPTSFPWDSPITDEPAYHPTWPPTDFSTAMSSRNPSPDQASGH